MPPLAEVRPSHYITPSVFESERQGIFSRSWIFAGLTTDIPQANDYFRLDIAGRDVIVQNCGGVLRAFVNACSHRQSQIHFEPRGNRKLVCPYHGWSYDAEGVPTGIPCREDFPQVCANPAAFRLAQLALECAGSFMFVRREPAGPGLREFLGDATWEFLGKASAALAVKLDEFTGSLQTNWKIAIENALEGYHVPLVHRDTLGKINQFSRSPADIVNYLTPGSGHSHMINKHDPEWARKWQRIERELGAWPFHFDHYIHHLIFPNLTVTSFMGYSFHIQRFIPDAVDKTTVHSRIFGVHHTGQSIKGKHLLEQINNEGIRFTHSVFKEDQQACERVYRGLHSTDRPAVLSEDMESRITHFQRHYLRCL